MALHPHRIETEPVPEPVEGDRIGIMADTHGDAGLIAAGAECLRGRGCGRLFHLGDICDSAHPEGAAACLQQVAHQRIAPIRGNNEHTLLLDRSPTVAPEILAAIEAMPLSRRIASALLVHSLPCTRASGARCMIEALTAGHIRSFFRHYPDQVLFRGHGHHPEIVRPRPGAWSREPMAPGRIYRVGPGKPAVITCGALIEGLVLIWDQRQRTVTSTGLAGGARGGSKG